MTAQLDIFDCVPPLPNITFHGETFDLVLDIERLNKQQRRVHVAMSDECWRTLAEIEAITGDGQASISARLRSYASNEYLSQFYVKERRRRGEAERGLFEYRILRKSV
jgi:hypothetical protein